MLKIHHLNQSRSERTVWLAEELGLDYELVRHQRDPQTFRSPPSLCSVSPLGKSPVIEDDGTTVCESGAIVEYLIDRHDKGALRPARGTPEYLRYTHWMHCAESTLAAPVVVDIITAMTQAKSPLVDGFIQGEYDTLFKYLDTALGENGYVAGVEFTAADTMVAYLLWIIDGSALKKLGLAPKSTIADHPNIVNYLARLRARPAYRRAMERIGE